jgi:aryl-alcohol dehydrogenase-like predicted oxidoreductase
MQTKMEEIVDGRQLCLGTVQLGVQYGIANRTGKPDQKTAFEILDLAFEGGIRRLDTAQSYGESESLIGEYHRARPDRQFKVVSKLDPRCDPEVPGEVVDQVRRSVDCLQAPLDALLLHDPTLLHRWNSGFGAALSACIGAGLTRHIGVSTYTPEEFDLALGLPAIDVIQAPVNALDRRLIAGGQLSRARDVGKTIYLRSVFLQGLLLLDLPTLPDAMSFAMEALLDWRALCGRYGMTSHRVALGYLRARVPDGITLIGCERPEQLQMNLAEWRAADLPEELLAEVDALPLPSERVLNPSLWKS